MTSAGYFIGTHGLDPGDRDSGRRTSLHFAATSGNVAAMEYPALTVNYAPEERA